MTQAQLDRNSKAGKACYAKYGSAFMSLIGRKGGSIPKSIIYMEPEKNNQEGVMPASYAEKVKALFQKENLIKGGLTAYKR